MGSPIGEFAGPTSGSFDKWVAFYKCWSAAVAVSPREETTSAPEAIPCGYTVDDDKFGKQFLRETGYKPVRVADFAVNGEDFNPEHFRVAEYCDCWWYRLV